MLGREDAGIVRKGLDFTVSEKDKMGKCLLSSEEQGSAEDQLLQQEK